MYNFSSYLTENTVRLQNQLQLFRVTDRCLLQESREPHEHTCGKSVELLNVTARGNNGPREG